MASGGGHWAESKVTGRCSHHHGLSGGTAPSTQRWVTKEGPGRLPAFQGEANGPKIIRPEMGGQVHLISNKASSSQVQGRLPGPGSGPRWASNWLFGQRGDQQPCPHPQVHRHPMTPFSQLPNKSLGHRGQQQGWKWWTRPCTKAGWRAPRPLKHWSMLRPGDTGGDAHT